MLEGFPICIGMDPIIKLFVVGEIHFLQGIYAAKLRILCSKVCTTQENGVNIIANCSIKLFQVLNGNITLFLENSMYIFGTHNHRHVPLSHITYPFWVFQVQPWYERNVSKGCATHVV